MTEPARIRPAYLLLLVALAGCTSIGPGTVPRDRISYITAVAESWKEQTLLNIVRMRYGDTPAFLDVSSVISSYALQGQLSAAGQFSSDLTATIPSRLATVGGNLAYVDRPTISYTPVAGDKFAQSLLRPIPPSAIFELIQAGYRADAVLQLTTRAINGIYNRSSYGGWRRSADPEFYPLLDALRRLQLSGSVSLRRQPQGPNLRAALMFSARVSTEAERDLRFVEKTLNVTPDRNGEITLAFGAVSRDTHEIALLSRSMLEILLEVGGGIEVPQKDVAQGRTAPSGRFETAPNPRDRPFVRIRSSATRPADTFAAVNYRGTWYWIDDDDIQSKTVFSFLMTFFSLAETGVTPQRPVLTVPVN